MIQTNTHDGHLTFGVQLARMVILGLAIAATLVIFPAAGLAQASPEAGGILPEIPIREKGWTQLTDREEMVEFLLALVEASVLTALITYHPVSLAARRTVADYEVPRVLFTYGLLGMVVGFLVIHHGYLIGFVIFGIGGLLRFRTSVESSADTSRLILVTLVGLCVGLDLPVMALITTASAWTIIYLLSLRTHFNVEVKFADKRPVHESIDSIKARLRECGFETVTVQKSKFKPTAEFVLSGAAGAKRDVLMRELMTLQMETGSAIEDWHMD